MRFCSILLLLLVPALLHAQADGVWLDSLQAYWDRLEAEFRDPAQSPLEPRDRAHFTGLERFAPDPRFRVQARFIAEPGKAFAMRTTTDRRPVYEPVGRLSFELEGKSLALSVYRNEELSQDPAYANYLFVPFTDLTNGESTYGAGRYLDLQGPLAEVVELDLNKAYNPYCAYNNRYSCPIPPAENHLPVAVEAGVKATPH